MRPHNYTKLKVGKLLPAKLKQENRTIKIMFEIIFVASVQQKKTKQKLFLSIALIIQMARQFFFHFSLVVVVDAFQ